jgi:hypothetical protein
MNGGRPEHGVVQSVRGQPSNMHGISNRIQHRVLLSTRSYLMLVTELLDN